MSGSAIVRVTTVHLDALPSIIWVEIETADGRTGLGETYGTVETLEAYLHEVSAPYLVGRDADDIERHWWAAYRNWGPSGVGVESRAISAVDMSLWDLLGSKTGLPLATLLGGAVRDSVPAYNTCGGSEYGLPATIPGADVWAVRGPGQPYEDLWAWQHEPERLAGELVAMGFPAMKIWPLDEIADETGGTWISPAGLGRGLEPLRRIREAHGDAIEIALELHGRWTLPAAIQIAQAAEAYRPIWFEDPVPIEDLDALGTFVRATRIPTLAGESLGTFHPYRDLVERGGVGIVSTDPAYVGGPTAARRVADLASLHRRSLTTHDCNGPVNLAVGVHLGLHAESLLMVEMVRAFYLTWYPAVADGLPGYRDGRLYPTGAPGHGVRLRPDVHARPDAHVRTSA